MTKLPFMAMTVSLSMSFTMISHATSYASPSDFEAVSPNGQYRFVADYPEPVDFVENHNTNISYTLFDTGTGAARWSLAGDYDTRTSENWPSRAYGAYVGNDGDVLTYGPERTVFTPLAAVDGAVGPRLSYDFKLPYATEPAAHRFVARNRIMRYAFRAVIEANDQSYLLTRVSWGERQLIALTQ